MNALWAWRLAWRNIFRNWQRNAILAVTLASSYGGILLFSGYVVWVEKYLRANTVLLNQTGHLTISRTADLDQQLTHPATSLLNKKDIEGVITLIKGEPSVSHIGYGLRGLVRVVRGCSDRGVVAIGRDPATEAIVQKHGEARRWLGELLKPEMLQVLQQGQTKSPLAMTVIPTPPLKSRLTVNRSDCSVVVPEDGPYQLLARTVDGYNSIAEAFPAGEQSSGLAMLDDRIIFLPLKDLQRLLETESVGSIAVFVDSLLSVPGVYSRLREKLANQTSPLVIQPFWSESVGLYYIGSVGFLVAVSVFFVGLVAVVVALSLICLMTMTLGERSLELGVLLAQGFPQRIVVRLITLEAIMLTLGSLVVGGLLSYGVSLFINAANIRFTPPGIAGSTAFTIAWEIWVVVAIGALFLLSAGLAIHSLARRRLNHPVLHLLQGATTL